MSERRWITREEIAEIHEAISKKIALEVASDTSFVRNTDDKWDHYMDHKHAARDVRATDKLGNMLGNRV